MTDVLAIVFLWTVAAMHPTVQTQGQAPFQQRPVLNFMPAEWVRGGMPPFVDRTKPIEDCRYWAGFQLGIRARATAGTLVLPRDFEMVDFLLTQFPGRNEDFDVFVTLAWNFVGTPYEARARTLLRQILQDAIHDPNVRALAAVGLTKTNDMEATWDMLDALSQANAMPEVYGAAAKVLRKCVRRVGQTVPPDLDHPESD